MALLLAQFIYTNLPTVWSKLLDLNVVRGKSPQQYSINSDGISLHQGLQDIIKVLFTEDSNYMSIICISTEI